ncbi:MAG: hypothetical protein E6G24_10320 [Actinobacteria bacterium]|nr:MAG: hypothetical protein E6G24_10320 [Actinomycetota bacterium]
MGTRRAAALAALALIAAGCGSSSKTTTIQPVATSSTGVVRVALADLLWPLDPARARTRDEIVVARALFATPLRTDPSTGALRAGLCSSWAHVGTNWHFRCRHARAIAQELRRAHVAHATVRAGSLSIADPQAPYLLTEAVAAPPGVPGPFRLVSLVLERNGLKLIIRKLDPEAALRLFRAGKLDEAPVPLGDLQALLRDPRLDVEVHIHRLLAVDLVAGRAGRALDRFPKLRQVYDDTADRADYQALVPELEAPPAESLSPPPKGAKIARAAALAFARARKQIGSLPHVAVRFAEPANPDLAYGESLLVAAWRDIGLGAYVSSRRPDATLERVLAPYPRTAALRAAVGSRRFIPISWVVDARLVSRRLAGWREDDLGAVDYTGIKFRASSRSR